MDIVILAAPTPFAQVLQHLTSDAAFPGLLDGGIFPDLTKPPAKQMPTVALPRFARVSHLTDAPVTPGANHRMAFLIELHDLPDNGRKTITEAAERAEWIFDGRLWERATASLRVPLRSVWLSTSGPYPDLTYKTSKLLCQFVLSAH